MQISALSLPELDACADADARAAVALGRSVERLLTDLHAQAASVALLDDRPLSPDERALSLDTFVRVLDLEAALGTLSRTHLDFWELSQLSDPVRCARHFVLGFAAYLNELALGLSFVRDTQGRVQFEILLDEGSERHGIPCGAFARLKEAVLDAAHPPRVFAARQYHEHVARPHYRELTETQPATKALLDLIEASYLVATVHFGVESALWLVANGLDVLRDGAHRALMPVQARVCAWLGDTRVRGRPALISPAQIDDARRRCRTGDLLLERRNWYLSNLGLPGFWPHLALWLGSPAELAEELDADDEVRAAYGSSFTARLRQRHPRAWSDYCARDQAGHERRVIEAVSEGVVFASAEHSLAADYAAALRPRLPKVEVARAVERAFEHAGLPYDFDFDCYSDRSVVCSELVYKAYEPRREARGLRLSLTRLAGRMTLPPNDLVAQLDREWGSERQALDLVWFLDGRERSGAARWADESEFRASHRRPKWDIAQD